MVDQNDRNLLGQPITEADVRDAYIAGRNDMLAELVATLTQLGILRELPTDSTP